MSETWYEHTDFSGNKYYDHTPETGGEFGFRDLIAAFAVILIWVCPIALFLFLWVKVFSNPFYGLIFSAIIAWVVFYYIAMPFSIYILNIIAFGKQPSKNEQEYRPLSLYEQWELKKKEKGKKANAKSDAKAKTNK